MIRASSPPDGRSRSSAARGLSWLLMRPFVALVLVGTLASGHVNSAAQVDPRPPTIVRHAGGGWQGRTYTNASGAIANSIALGARLIEIDLTPSADGGWHCLHDYREVLPPAHWLRSIDVWLQRWYARAPRWAYPPASVWPSEASLRAWLAADHARGIPTRCNLEEAALMAQRTPGVQLVTDTKYDNYRLLERLVREPSGVFVPQVYNAGEFRHAAQLGFKRIIYTLYKQGDYSALLPLIEHPALWKIVFPAQWLCANSPAPPPTWLNNFRGERLVHTVNPQDTLCPSKVRIDGWYSDWAL